ncbi:3-oxoacyl-ACP reductase family protein [Streptomyces sp. NBC_00140]|uniref:3-oxoacyl-ACP reductase family protein n=1 Tax=Streptomyces sp. NBC_00140 TaxID=2975664 RepID=UPI002255B8FA|nr:3-oxoacyl-ACP reductase family protein [Streptomyces sp. NBC_00140]MCX5336227.1 3-oxoacyl-ACP reductase FabG [Streptomyces sp. NBC_00140]
MSPQLAPDTVQPGVRPLDGKTALVTGGSRGIGAAIVRRLTADGARVAFTYASAKEQADAVAEATGALAVQADNADHEAVRAAVSRTAKHFGGLDILVNNAGVAHIAPIEDFPLEEFDRLIAVNVRGVFSAVQAATPHLGQGGRIITIGSVIVDRVPFPGASVYALTKAAVAGLTRGLARELGPHGITVNNVQPGPTATDMTPDSGPYAEALKQLMPLDHFAEPADIASVVAYLAGPEAHFITGTSWNVDGGITV